MELEELNRRVRQAADKLPPGLRESYKAIGYRACQLEDDYVVTAGFGLGKISELSQRYYPRSKSQLRRDLQLFVRCGVAEVVDITMAGEPDQPKMIKLYFAIPAEDIASAVEDRRQLWRKQRPTEHTGNEPRNCPVCRPRWLRLARQEPPAEPMARKAFLDRHCKAVNKLWSWHPSNGPSPQVKHSDDDAWGTS